MQGWRLPGRGTINEPQVWVRPLADTAHPAGGAARGGDGDGAVSAAAAALRRCCRGSTADATRVAVALFNGAATAAKITLGWSELGWRSPGKVVAVAWDDTHVNDTGTGIESTVLPHQAVVVIVQATAGTAL